MAGWGRAGSPDIHTPQGCQGGPTLSHRFLSHENKQAVTHHDSSAQADDFAPHGARYHVPIADGQECDWDQPQCVCEVSRGIDSLPMGKGNLVLRRQPGGAGVVYPPPQHSSSPFPTLNPKRHLDRKPKMLAFSLLCDLAQTLKSRNPGLASSRVSSRDPSGGLNHPFSGVTYWTSCMSDIYIKAHNSSRITVRK